MSRVLTRVLMVAVALLVAVSLASAAEEAKKGGKRRPGQMDPFFLPQSIELTAEQKTKLEDIKKEFGEKFAAAAKKAALTEEQRKARREAAQKARDEGKSREEAQKAIEEAVKLTDDQKAAQKEARGLFRTIREKISGILTDEQKAKLKSFGKGKRGKGKPANPTT